MNHEKIATLAADAAKIDEYLETHTMGPVIPEGARYRWYTDNNGRLQIEGDNKAATITCAWPILVAYLNKNFNSREAVTDVAKSLLKELDAEIAAAIEEK